MKQISKTPVHTPKIQLLTYFCVKTVKIVGFLEDNFYLYVNRNQEKKTHVYKTPYILFLINKNYTEKNHRLPRKSQKIHSFHMPYYYHHKRNSYKKENGAY